MMEIKVNNPKELRNTSFSSELDLLDYITENINKFVIDILDDKLVSFEREKACNEKQGRFGSRVRRVDLYIVGEQYKYIIELKNPKYVSENRKAIGQLLDYGRNFSYTRKKMILITTLFDIETAKTIEFYNLPISYIYFDKDKIMEYIREDNG